MTIVEAMDAKTKHIEKLKFQNKLLIKEIKGQIEHLNEEILRYKRICAILYRDNKIESAKIILFKIFEFERHKDLLLELIADLTKNLLTLKYELEERDIKKIEKYLHEIAESKNKGYQNLTEIEKDKLLITSTIYIFPEYLDNIISGSRTLIAEIKLPLEKDKIRELDNLWTELSKKAIDDMNIHSKVNNDEAIQKLLSFLTASPPKTTPETASSYSSKERLLALMSGKPVPQEPIKTPALPRPPMYLPPAYSHPTPTGPPRPPPMAGPPAAPSSPPPAGPPRLPPMPGPPAAPSSPPPTGPPRPPPMAGPPTAGPPAAPPSQTVSSGIVNLRNEMLQELERLKRIMGGGRATPSEPPMASTPAQPPSTPSIAKPEDKMEEITIKKEEKFTKSIERFADIKVAKEMEIEKESQISIEIKRDQLSVTGYNLPITVMCSKTILNYQPEIEILIVAPGFEIPIARKKLIIPLATDSESLEFIVIPKLLGNQFILVEIYQESKMLGRIFLKVEIKRKVKGEIQENIRPLNFAIAPNFEIDLTLRIVNYANKFRFDLFTRSGGAVISPDAFSGVKSLDIDYINTLNDLIRKLAFESDETDKSVKSLIDIGRKVYEIIPERMRDAIKKLNPKYFIIETGDLFVPFELAHDGENFLCLKYCMGKRIIDETRDFSIPPACFGTPEFDFIILESNPKNDLDLKEKDYIQKFLQDRKFDINFQIMKGKDINKKAISDLLLKPLEIIHFAGHGTFDNKDPDKSGIILENGDLLSARDIKNMKINNYPLIFANTCEAATIKKVDKMKGVSGLARAFLGSGAIGFIGPLWEISDDLAAEFAYEFYKSILDEKLSIGEAIRKVKTDLKGKFSNILWATFNYYGDPTLRLCPKLLV